MFGMYKSKWSRTGIGKKYLLVLFMVLAVFWCVQMYFYHREQNANLNTIYQLAGELEQGVSEKEAIANLLKQQENPEAAEEGLAFFMEYGYGEDYESVYDIREKEYAGKLLLQYVVFYVFLIFLLSRMQERRNRNHQDTLQALQTILEQFYNGNYDYLTQHYEEDTEGILTTQLESLGQKLKLNEERLEQEKEETKALVTDLSHQLKTPVASIQMSYQLLEDENLEEQERREFLNRLGGQIHHLEGLLEALVNISRMESGMIHIQKEEANVFQTIVQAVNDVYVKAEKKGIAIEIPEVSEEIEKLTLPHDTKWTKEAIANVLDNAVKYSPKSSMVRITIIKQVHFLRIEIADEGIGIPKEEVNHIFQRFYRGKNRIIRQTEGSGVGLYLARKILEEQGGNISVVFPFGKEMQGTTFAVMLGL